MPATTVRAARLRQIGGRFQVDTVPTPDVRELAVALLVVLIGARRAA